MIRNWNRTVAVLAPAVVLGLLCGSLGWAAKPTKPPPPPPPSTVSYALITLGTLGGNESGAKGMNEVGDVVGWSDTDGAGRHAFVCTFLGPMGDLNVVAASEIPDDWVLNGWVLNSASDINTMGQIVGNSGMRGFRYTPAQGDEPAEFLDLGALGMRIARAINESGDVVGSSLDADGGEYPCIYTDLSREVQPLPPTADGRQWRAWAINNSGQVSGCTINSRQEAVRYTPGIGAIPLGTFKMVVDAQWSDGVDINDAGQVVGWATVARRTNHAFRYTDGVMKDLGTLGGSQSSATGINSVGHVVGTAQTAAGGTAIFLYTDQTGMVNLTASIVGLPPGFYPGAGRINKMGVMCGTGEYADGTWEANLLIPFAP